MPALHSNAFPACMLAGLLLQYILEAFNCFAAVHARDLHG
jgi:hypothetical protein